MAERAETPCQEFPRKNRGKFTPEKRKKLWSLNSLPSCTNWHELVLDNPVPAKDLAKSIGKPYSTLLREVNPYDTGAKLGAETLLQIMTQTGDLKPLEFMASSLGYELAPRKGEKPAKSAKAL